MDGEMGRVRVSAWFIYTYWTGSMIRALIERKFSHLSVSLPFGQSHSRVDSLFQLVYWGLFTMPYPLWCSGIRHGMVVCWRSSMV